MKLQKGYSLMELVIVMAVAGLILGGVTAGRDVLREAEYNRIHNRFLLPWKQTYDLYYQRTGVVIGDNQVAPTLMVNGYEASMDNRLGGLAGIPGNYRNTAKRICQGAGYPANTVGGGDSAMSGLGLHMLLDRAGIEMPSGRTTGQEDRYIYNDSNNNPVELQICFQWNPDRTISGSGNVMVIRGLTPDLARKLDQMIDGVADAHEGRFRQQNLAPNSMEISRQIPGSEWSGNNTYSANNLNPTAFGAGEYRNEDRVMLVTAHWTMER